MLAAPFYIHGTLIAALIFYVVVLGPFLLIAGVTFGLDAADRTALCPDDLRPVVPPLSCGLAGHLLKPELPGGFPAWARHWPMHHRGQSRLVGGCADGDAVAAGSGGWADLGQGVAPF